MNGIRIAGEPLHPALVHFPIALLATSLLWDGLALWQHEPFWWQMSFWSLAAGLAAAVPAVITGFVDFTALPTEHPAEQLAIWHLSVVAVAILLYLGSLAVRGSPAPPVEGHLYGAVALSVLGLIALLVGGLLGGRLVYRHGVGMHDGTLNEQ